MVELWYIYGVGVEDGGFWIWTQPGSKEFRFPFQYVRSINQGEDDVWHSGRWSGSTNNRDETTMIEFWCLYPVGMDNLILYSFNKSWAMFPHKLHVRGYSREIRHHGVWEGSVYTHLMERL